MMVDPESRIRQLERRLEALAVLCGQSLPDLDSECEAIKVARTKAKGA